MIIPLLRYYRYTENIFNLTNPYKHAIIYFMDNKLVANKNKIAYLRHDEVTEKLVSQKMRETGLDQSKAIRVIIREWAQMKEQYITLPVKGFIDDAGNVRYSDAPADRED